MFITKILAGMVIVTVLAVGVVLGGVALEVRAADRLDTTMGKRAQGLLPSGQIDAAHVTDDPALLAARRPRVQQTIVDGRGADGHPVMLIVREYDRETRRAQSVSWNIEGLQLAPGWTGLRSDNGAYRNRAVRQVDGHRVEVSGAARIDGSQIAIAPDRITIDGAPVELGDAPAAVQRSLSPLTIGMPLVQAGAAVRSLWFDEAGLGLEVYARDVSTGKA